MKREWRTLIERKKENNIIKMITEAGEDKTGKKFWELVKSRRSKKKTTFSKTIRGKNG